MIAFWDRREVFLTREMRELHRVCSILSSNQIDYVTRSNSMTNLGRYHGVPNIRMDGAYQYRVFVHKRDLEWALHLLRLS